MVDVDDAELALLTETGTAMAHCPQANARLGSGIAPAARLHKLGGTVSLAVDGAAANEAADMGMALYTAFALQRAAGGAGAARAETVLHWATAGGAAALGLPLCGTLAPGMAADIAILDLDRPRHLGCHDLALSPIVTGDVAVRNSFVGGSPVIVEGRLCAPDPADLAQEAQRTVARLTHSDLRALPA